MRKIRFFEQADRTGENITYSWILDVDKRTIYGLFVKQLPAWKWVSGRPGCFVTNDKTIAEKTAVTLGLIIQSNGSHAVHNAPRLLIDIWTEN